MPLADYLANPETHLDEAQIAALAPGSWTNRRLHRTLADAVGIAIRLSFRFHVAGRNQLPPGQQMILAPNHESSLDAPLLAAALPYQILRQTYWASREGRTFQGAARWLNRVLQAIPVRRNLSALAAGAAVLNRGYHLVWFPEGRRSRDGRLQEFRFGVGALARHFDVPVMPVGIEGAYEAYPPNQWLPRFFSQITVRFGTPIDPSDTPSDERAMKACREFANRLHDHVKVLSRGTHALRSAC